MVSRDRDACRVSAGGAPKPDTPVEARVAALAGARWGVVSLDDLRACGAREGAIRRWVRLGRLHRIHRGVYAVGHRAIPRRGEFLAAILACGARAVLSHFSAAELWRLATWPDRYPEVLLTGTAPRAHAGILVHRTRSLAPVEIRLRDGMPVTSPARTLIDLAGALDHRRLRRLVREAQALRLVTAAELASAVAAHRRRRGVGSLRRILATGPAPTRSVLEDVLLDLLLDAGIARPDVNRSLLVGGRRVVPDFRWPAARLIVEADGAAWHENPTARADDVERQALLEGHGERVVRVSWEQAIGRRSETVRRILAAGAPLAADRGA